MNFRLATLIAVPLLGAALYLTHLALSPTETIARTDIAVSVDPTSHTVPLKQDSAGNMAELAALRQEMTSLRTMVQAQQYQIPKQASSVPSRVDSPPADTRLDQNAREEATNARMAQIQKVDAAFRQQAIDQTWSTRTISAIHDALNSPDVEGVHAESIDCRSSSCRVELDDNGTGQLNKSLPILALQLAGSMPNIVANTAPRGDGTSNVVLYMSRESGEPDSR